MHQWGKNKIKSLKILTSAHAVLGTATSSFLTHRQCDLDHVYSVITFTCFPKWPQYLILVLTSIHIKCTSLLMYILTLKMKLWLRLHHICLEQFIVIHSILLPEVIMQLHKNTSQDSGKSQNSISVSSSITSEGKRLNLFLHEFLTNTSVLCRLSFMWSVIWFLTD